MSILSYYGRLLLVAFRHPFGVADAISTALGMLLPVIGRLNPKWGAATNDLAWQIPLTAFLTLAGARLILAPYWMYRERIREANDLETHLREQISQKNNLLDERAKYKSIREQLSHYMGEGQELLTAFQRTHTASPWDQKTRDWVDRVEQFLITIDTSYVARFSSAPTKIYPESSYNNVRDWVNLIYTRVCQLEEFIKEHSRS